MSNRVFWPLLLAVALGLRLWQISAAMWYDEVFSALVAALPLERLIEAAGGDVHPPTYYLLLAGIGRIFGYSEIIMRLPSLLAGLLLIPLVYRLALAVGAQTGAARLAAAITALAPFQIHYSIEARSYALLTLAAALAALGLVERRYWLAVAGSLAALYLHNTAALFLAPLWLASMRRERRYWLAAALVAVGYTPGALWALAQAGHITGNYWIPPAPNVLGRMVAILDDMVFFAHKSPWVFASALVTALALLLLLADARRLIASQVRLLLAAVFGPLLLLTALSWLWQPLLVSRVMAPATPFYYIALALAATRSRRRLVTLGALAAPVLLATYIGLFTWAVGRDPVDYNMAVSMQQFDAIYHSSVGGAVVWRYYLPDVPQFLRPQPHTGLNETLSQQTRQALGLQEIDLDLIKCATVNTPAAQRRPLRRWAFLYFHNPVTSPAEIEYVASTMQRYKTNAVQTLRQDDTVHAGLVELLPECDHVSGLLNSTYGDYQRGK